MKHQPILKLSWAYIEIKIEREIKIPSNLQI